MLTKLELNEGGHRRPEAEWNPGDSCSLLRILDSAMEEKKANGVDAVYTGSIDELVSWLT